MSVFPVGWQDRAACIGMSLDLFFPVGETGPGAVQADRAKAVCAGCEVRADCLSWALAARQDYGVAGGLTEDERRRLRRNRQRQALRELAS